MELRHLKYFMVLAEELHFRKAAERLFISQPPLSRQIKELEGELGVQLFQRSKKSVNLTEAGQFLKEEVAHLFTRLESIKRKVKEIDLGEAGHLQIGYVSSAIQDVLARVLLNLKKDLPGISTSLYELNTIRQTSLLSEGQLDVGIMRAPIKSDQFVIYTLYKENFALLVPKGHPMIHSPKQQLQEVAKEPFIFFAKDYSPEYYNDLMHMCNRAGFTPNIAHEAINMHSIVRLVEKGLGVSIVPFSVSQMYKNLEVDYIELTSTGEKTETVVAYRKDCIKPSVFTFVNLLLKLNKQIME
ncbi:LysR substrate-binding domain-containing protein [Rapidithrix thailandica]|uniref:LysR substrate-binding domain-containing protein n=1 Tax=Rapidithrix thailandica TaxID=413964 RepID=A0AAW9SF65_9BACT